MNNVYYGKLIFELSKPGRIGYSLPKNDIQEYSIDELPECVSRKTSLDLPEADDAQADAAEEGHPHLLPDDLPDVPGLHIPQTQAADDGDGGLGAGIAAGVHEHRDKGSQHHLGHQRVLKAGDDHARKGGGDHQKHQPRDALPVGVERR